MAQTENLSNELDALVAEAMQQPGVADVMAVYGQLQQADQSARETMQSLRAHWQYQSSNSSS